MQSNGIDQTRLALAALAACTAKALGEQVPDFQRKFEKYLENAYHQLQDAEVPHTGAMETLHWTKQFFDKL